MPGRSVLGSGPVPATAAPPGDDGRFMARALALSEQGWGQVSPNPLAGAVVVSADEIVGEGAHRRFGGAHAEVEALAAAGSRARGGTMYVTLEPCIHQGKTPPCVDAIIGAGLLRVVVAIRDPNPAAAGGLERLRAAGVQVDVGMLAADAAELNAPFLNAFRSDRPWVTLKLAVSLDGAIADCSRRPGWLTGPEARRRVHHLRAGSDAIGVGMGTVLADDPRLTVRDAAAPRIAPLRVVFSRTGRLPLTSNLAQRSHQSPVLVFASTPDPGYERELRGLGVEVMPAATLVDGLRLLKSRGVASLLVEGGASLAASMIEANLIDRIVLFQAPVLLGEGALPAFGKLPATQALEGRRWRPIHSEWIGDDHMVLLAPGAR